MNPDVTTSAAFAKRAEQWREQAPIMAALCRTIAAEPELAACTETIPVSSVEGNPRHTNVWARPHLLFALVTRRLRDTGGGHELARYWRTLGGRRGEDAVLAEVFRDFVDRDRAELADLAGANPASRQNNPATAAMLWPGIAWAADRAATPVALLELGSAAGLCLYLDRYGYRYGGQQVRPDSPLVLETEFDGDIPAYLDADVTVVSRTALEQHPIRREDTEAVAWLRDCVFPDHDDRLADLDNALSLVEPGGIDWREGDFMETLPRALADIPAGATPIVFEAHTLCCAPRPERLPAILEAAGRDLVWVSAEHPDVALGLVADAGDYVTGENEPQPSLMTAVRFTPGHDREIWVLGGSDEWGSKLEWRPRAMTPTG